MAMQGEVNAECVQQRLQRQPQIPRHSDNALHVLRQLSEQRETRQGDSLHRGCTTVEGLCATANRNRPASPSARTSVPGRGAAHVRGGAAGVSGVNGAVPV